MNSSDDLWNKLLVSEGEDLLILIDQRLYYPDTIGPGLNDKSGEAAWCAIKEEAKNNSDFRVRLQNTINNHFNDMSYLFYDYRMCALLDLIQFIPLYDCFNSSKNLIDKYKSNFNDQHYISVLRDLLAAVAMTQPRTKEMENWWVRLASEIHIDCLPRVFFGLRIQNLKLALDNLNVFIVRSKASSRDPEAMIYGAYASSPNDVEDWIKENSDSDLIKTIEEVIERNCK